MGITPLFLAAKAAQCVSVPVSWRGYHFCVAGSQATQCVCVHVLWCFGHATGVTSALLAAKAYVISMVAAQHLQGRTTACFQLVLYCSTSAVVPSCPLQPSAPARIDRAGYEDRVYRLHYNEVGIAQGGAQCFTFCKQWPSFVASFAQPPSPSSNPHPPHFPSHATLCLLFTASSVTGPEPCGQAVHLGHVAVSQHCLFTPSSTHRCRPTHIYV